MKKWIFVNHITSLDKLYLLTKTIKNEVVTESNHTEVLMNALNRNGAKRTEPNSHPIRFVLFYLMVELKNDRYVLTKDGEDLLKNYDKILKDKKYKSSFFFNLLLKIKFPNVAVETDKSYDVYPFRIIFKLLLDNRVDRKISLDEFENLLSIVSSEDDYEKLVDIIIKRRQGININYKIEKIAQVLTVISGWCNQFNVMKREGQYIKIADELNIKMPVSNKNTISMTIPYNADFKKHVLINYLFYGKAMNIIENEYFKLNRRRGFLVKDVLDYYLVNNEFNKGMYSGIDIDTVINILKLQNNDHYQKIGKLLSNDENQDEHINKISDYVDLFRKYYLKNISNMKKGEANKIKAREEFISEYPLERIKLLELDEYSLGVDNFKDSLSYKLEYGKYKLVGPSIGGNTSAKFGIYKSSNNEFIHGKEVISNPEEFFIEFKNQLYSFLKEYGESEKPIRARTKYPLLKGMSMVLTKLLFIYYPEKFINIASRTRLELLMRYFGYDFDDEMGAEELSYLFNIYIRRDIKEVNKNNPMHLGLLIWSFFENIINSNDYEEDEEEKVYDYNQQQFLKDVFIDDKEYDVLYNLLKRKKNIILSGPPGVGKTFMAKRLAYSIIEKTSKKQILSIQFHQSYSYEDFIEGIRPDENGVLELVDGVFKTFVNKAKHDSNNNYYVIIDEINRGNLSEIFGELMKLIEPDKREDETAVLPYSKEEFMVPKNLYIIGTMNTADRSLAMVDYALRRRFAFYYINPAFNHDKFKNYLYEKNNINKSNINQLCKNLISLNDQINQDLGKAFKIGHSYFIDTLDSKNFSDSYNEIVEYEVKPLLEEYFFNDDNIEKYTSLL